MKTEDDECRECKGKMIKVPSEVWTSKYVCENCFCQLFRVYQDRMSGCLYDPIDQWSDKDGKRLYNIEWAIR